MTDGELVLRDLTGNRSGASARTPGQPGTRRHNRLVKIGEFYSGASPVEAALASGQLDIPLIRQIEEETGMPVFGGPAEQIDPAEIIMQEIARSAGYVRDLEALVAKFEEYDLAPVDVIETEEEKVGGGEAGDYTVYKKERRRQINLIWQLYEKERKHLAGVASAAVKAGLELRRIRIQEAQLDRVQTAILLAMSDLGIDTGDSRVRTAIGTRLQELQNGIDPTKDPIQVPAERELVPVTPPPMPAEF